MSWVDFLTGRMEEDARKDRNIMVGVPGAGYIEEFNVGDKVWPVFIDWLHEDKPWDNDEPNYLPMSEPLTILDIVDAHEDSYVRVSTSNCSDITLSFKNYVCVSYAVKPVEKGLTPDTTQYMNRVEGSELIPITASDVYSKELIENIKSAFNKDNVNHPDHYAGEIECKDAMIQQFGVENYKIFCQLNAFKYIWRSNMKHETPDEDLAKANWYLTEYKELSQQAK